MLNDAWYSADGKTWTQATAAAAFPARASHSSVVFNNEMWVIGGENKSANPLDDVWESP
jgi:N-acetylneuraminic acid mutarotase